jgi:hypothetical protein
MFDRVINYLHMLWGALKGILQGTWNIIRDRWAFLVGLFMALAAITESVVGFVCDTFVYALEAIGILSNSMPGDKGIPPGIIDALNFANVIFPLQESFTMTTILMVVMQVSMVYRLIKSYLPSAS